MKSERAVKFETFCFENKDLLGERSVIWEEFSKDFGENVDNVRGYGINNRHKSSVVFRYLKLNTIVLRFLDKLSTLYIWFSRALKFIFSRMLSAIIFKKMSPAKKYSFKDYSVDDYKRYNLSTGYLDRFLHRSQKEKYGVEFSHHTFKAFCYLEDFCNECPDFNFEGKKILEIGGGMLNFSILCFERVNKVFYVVVDLPEMIEAASHNVSSIVDDVDIFLPHEVEDALLSKADKRLLFLLPGQLSKFDEKFELFVNHESFAEMQIHTAKGYLDSVREKMSSSGYVFLVNRFFRVQYPDDSDLEQLTTSNITTFDHYMPKWCNLITYKVETFRQHIRTQQDRPNVFYIGKVPE